MEIKTRNAEGLWVVRAGGAVLGETRRAVELIEDGQKPVIYFPREDIAMAMLEPSATLTTCKAKGKAQHYSIHTKSTLIEDAGWSYEAPLDAASAIAGHIAFDKSKVTVERL